VSDPTVAEPWVAAPLRKLMEDARLISGVLLYPSGRAVGQFGFTNAADVMSICALTSAINASARELGRQLDGKPFYEMHHAGADRQVFMARASAGAQEFLFVGVFDRESSLGVVEMYFTEFQKALEKLRPDAPVTTPAIKKGADFEGELNRSLDALFGPIGKR
jgi:predicted regulator of Ras-like GTPase activity (Roadblock/LC7/MglB family)